MPGASSATGPAATPEPVRLHVLGAGSILPRAGYGASGYALEVPGEGLTLLDCGPGSLRALGELGFGVGDVRAVVLSHFHPDHCLDVLALGFARRNPALSELGPLELIGPVGLAAWLSRATEALGRWVADPRAQVREVALDATGRGHSDSGRLRLTCAPTGHTPEALAWRVQFGERSLTYSGDSPPSPDLERLARGSDWFLCECSFADADAQANHLTPSGAAAIARDARCARLILTHFYPSLDPADAAAVAARTFDGPIETARDGALFELA